MSGQRVRLGRMPGRGRPERAWRLVWVATFVGLAVVFTGHARAGEVDAPGAVLGGLVVLTLVAQLSLDTWVDPARGRIGRRSLWCLRWGVRLAEAEVLRLRPDHRGAVLLQVRAPRRWHSIWVPVAAADGRGPRAQPPLVLRLLAGEVRAWAAARHHHVADDLDAQADHLEAGGSILDSPLVLRHGRVRIPL